MKRMIMTDLHTLLLLHFEGNFNDSSTYSRKYKTLLGGEITHDESDYFFDGKGSVFSGIVFPHDDAFNFGKRQFTIECRLNMNNKADSYQGIAGKRKLVSKAGSWCFGLKGRNLYLGISNNGNSFTTTMTSTEQVPENSWVHVAFSLDGTFAKGFIEGKKVMEGTYAAPIDTDLDLVVANLLYGESAHGLKGYMDELCISDICKY